MKLEKDCQEVQLFPFKKVFCNYCDYNNVVCILVPKSPEVACTILNYTNDYVYYLVDILVSCFSLLSCLESSLFRVQWIAYLKLLIILLSIYGVKKLVLYLIEYIQQNTMSLNLYFQYSSTKQNVISVLY